MRRWARGGFRPVEFEFAVKNWKNCQLELKKWNSKFQKNRKIGFLVIALTGSLGFGPDLVGIFPRSLPQLSKQLRDQNNMQKHRKNLFFIVLRVFTSFIIFLISIFFFFLGFCLLFWSLSCLESCGRLLGKIPTKSGPNPWDPLWAMTKNPIYIYIYIYILFFF